MAMPILMLQSFPSQRGSSRRASNQKAATAHIRSRPNQVANALQSEHRVINEEGNRINAVIGISGAGRDKRAHRPGLRNSLFQNLTVLRLLVIKERVHIDRLVKLPNA